MTEGEEREPFDLQIALRSPVSRRSPVFLFRPRSSTRNAITLIASTRSSALR